MKATKGKIKGHKKRIKELLAALDWLNFNAVMALKENRDGLVRDYIFAASVLTSIVGYIDMHYGVISKRHHFGIEAVWDTTLDYFMVPSGEERKPRAPFIGFDIRRAIGLIDSALKQDHYRKISLERFWEYQREHQKITRFNEELARKEQAKAAKKKNKD